VFKNGILRGIVGPKMKEITRSWRKLHSENCMIYILLAICYQGEQRRMRWIGHVGLQEREEEYIQGFGEET
jgi:hypothetical protein